MGVVPCIRVNAGSVIVNGSMASLNVAKTRELTGTAVRSMAGMVEVTTGALVSDRVPVEKAHERSAARARPVSDTARVVTVAVKSPVGASAAVGEKMACFPLALVVTVPGTLVVPRISVNVAALSGAMGMSNVTEMRALVRTSSAASRGEVARMVGWGASALEEPPMADEVPADDEPPTEDVAPLLPSDADCDDVPPLLLSDPEPDEGALLLLSEAVPEDPPRLLLTVPEPEDPPLLVDEGPASGSSPPVPPGQPNNDAAVNRMTPRRGVWRVRPEGQLQRDMDEDMVCSNCFEPGAEPTVPLPRRVSPRRERRELNVRRLSQAGEWMTRDSGGMDQWQASEIELPIRSCGTHWAGWVTVAC